MRIQEVFKKFIEKLTTIELSSEKLDPILDEIALELIECDINYDVALKILEEVKSKLIGLRIPRGKMKDYIMKAIRDVLLNLIPKPFRLEDFIESRQKPVKILFVGPNGHGKTTTIAKIAYLLKRKYRVLLVCSDTMRAGAIEQLAYHAKKLGVKMVAQKYGADPAAVAYDALQHAVSKGYQVLLIDTAGRLETKKDLMRQLRKICKVIEPDLRIFVIDALTGQDATLIAEEFEKWAGIDAIIVTKMDADVKGGAALSVCIAVNKPIIYLGIGQKYEDLKTFDPEEYVNKILGLE